MAKLDIGHMFMSPDASTFEAVYTHRSINRAGRRIGLDAGHVSRVIRKLEHGLGAVLFTRHKNGLTPTPLADQIHTSVTQARSRLLEGMSTGSRRIKIAFHPIIGFRHMTARMTDSLLDLGLSPEFTFASSDKVIELLKNRETDFGLVHGSVKMPGMIVREIESQNSALVSLDGRAKKTLLIHPEASAASAGVSDLVIEATWPVSDHFLLAKMLTENAALMGVLPESLVAWAGLKTIRSFKDKSRVTAVSWPGSVGVELLKTLRK